MITLKHSLLLGLVSFALAFTGCTKKQDSATPAASSQAAPASFEGKTLNLYCWSNYLAPDVIKKFEERTKAKVVLNYFSSNEELLAKLQAGAKGYDIVVPTGYTVKALKELGLLEPLGPLDWPELAKLSPRFASLSFDPKHEVSVPYGWGTTAIAVNKKKFNGKIESIDSWSWLFDVEKHPELKGKITMLDDAPAVIGSAMKYLGYAYNEASPEAFEKVKALLTKQKKNVKAYTPETYAILEAGETILSQTYSVDALQIQNKKNPDIQFVLPKEGGEIFVDSLAIPKGSENVALAKAFMRFTLEREMAFQQMQHLFSGPVVDLGGMPGFEKFSSNPALFPPQAIFEKYEMMEENPARMEAIQRLWTELKSL